MKRAIIALCIVGIFLGAFMTFSASARPSLDDVRGKHEPNLIAIEGVSGVASDKAKNEIVVLVENKNVCDKVPKNLEGINVRCVAIGRIEALKPAAATAELTTTQIGQYTRTGTDRPVFGGISVGSSAWPGSAGTLGLVTMRGTSAIILSNAHVLAMASNGNLVSTANIWQPGGYDGGNALSKIGALTKRTTIQFNNRFANNYADAAYATLSSNVGYKTNAVLNSANTDFNTVKGTAAVSTGATVYKSGRTTSVTTSQVTATGATVIVWYTQAKYAVFKDQLLINNQPVNNQAFSAAGDSGSVIYNGSGQFVGLLFAGSDTITVANTAARVTTALGITI